MVDGSDERGKGTKKARGGDCFSNSLYFSYPRLTQPHFGLFLQRAPLQVDVDALKDKKRELKYGGPGFCEKLWHVFEHTRIRSIPNTHRHEDVFCHLSRIFTF